MMAMHAAKRKTLDRTLEFFTKDLDVTPAIIHLKSKEILKDRDEEKINAKDTEKEQVMQFVRTIKKRGEKAYQVFREYLENCQGSEHLAEEMDKNLQAVEEELQGLKTQADGMQQIERWKALEETFYCFSCKYDNIRNYTDIPEEINIILIGKTGSGKSATGNTIIGKPYFNESNTSEPVTKTISMKHLEEDKYHITVIDTPGLFYTAKDFQNEDLVLEIAKTMINFKGDIHLFLLVLSSTARFNQEEQDTINVIEKILGRSVYQNCLVVLTNARAKFGLTTKRSLREYVDHETKKGGKFADLLKHVSNRIIAVENCFDDDFFTEKHRQKLLCCLAQMIHDNKGSVYSIKALKKANVRVEQHEEERKKRVARETELQLVQREQELNRIMETLKENLYDSLKGKEDKDLDEPWRYVFISMDKPMTDLTEKFLLDPGNWQPLFTKLLGSQIEGSDISIIEVTNLFLKQNNNWLQSILGILIEKRQQQEEAKRLQKKEQLKNSAFETISSEIEDKLKFYLTGKTVSELVNLEAQIGRGEVPSDIYEQVYKKLTYSQKLALSRGEIEAEILAQIKEQNEVIEEFKKEVGICFAGSTEVRIKERGIANISNVRVDDEILVFDENGHLFCDKVYLISHAREDEIITFARLQTSSGKNLRISPGHLLPVGSLGSNVAAKDISLGNVIFTLQDGVMMPDKVTSVTYELCRGAYCPMTMYGNIVVNDVAASCYTTFFPARLAHALLSPIRFLFTYLPIPLFNRLLPYDTEEGMPVLLLKCRSIVIRWRSLFTGNDSTCKSL